MSFTIPHKADRVTDDQGQWDTGDLEILLNACGGVGGITYGCRVVTDSGLSVTVEAGACILSDGTLLAIAAGDVVHDTADVTNPRWDLVVITSAGAKAIRKGTPTASNAAYPALTAGDLVLAAVYVAANDTSISTGEIGDKRMMTNGPGWMFKAASQVVANSTTYVDDDDFVFPIGADEEWLLEFHIYCDAQNTADLKVQWTIPSGCVIEWGGLRGGTAASGSSVRESHSTWDLTGTGELTYGTAGFQPPGSTAELQSHRIFLHAVNGSTAGDITMQWAQNTAHSGDLTMRIGSYVKCQKIGG